MSSEGKAGVTDVEMDQGFSSTVECAGKLPIVRDVPDVYLV